MRLTKHRIKRYGWVADTPDHRDHFYAAPVTWLASGYPFVFGFSAHESFEGPQVAKTGVAPMPFSTEKPLGDHEKQPYG